MFKHLTRPRTWFLILVLPLAFSAAAQPAITSFTPASGPAGTAVTITGSGFNTTAAGNIVYFGAAKATVTAGSATSLTVTAPAGATYEPLSALNTATGLTGYASKPFALTFTNPFGTGLPTNYYLPRVPYATDYAPSAVTLGDVDGDGKSDLVVTSFVSIAILRNVSSTGSITPASFASPVVLPASSIYDIVVVKDIDGDGKPDVVGSSGYNNVLSIWRNTSSPGSITSASFAAPVTLPIAAPFSIYASSLAVGDLDGDGKPDLAVTLNPDQTAALAVFRNTSTPGNLNASSFARVEIPVAASPRWVAINDLDGDGKPDLITANQALNTSIPGMLSVLRNKAVPGSISAASFEPRVDFPLGSSVRSLAVGDIDGDGKPELIARSGAGISVLRNTAVAGTIGASSFSPKADFAFSASGLLTLGDVDGDGKPDILASGSTVLSVLRNTATSGNINAASFAPQTDFASSDAGSGTAIGDLDGDGVAEVVITNNSAFSVSVMKVNPSSLAAAPQVNSFAPLAGPVGTAVTINGTGFNPAPAGNLVYFGAVKAVVTGASSTSLTVTAPAGATYQPLSVLNTANGLTGYASKPFITTFSNPYAAGIPFNFYKPRVDFGTGTLPYAVALGDLDGDGKTDMVAVNASAGTVSVLRNTAASGLGGSSFAGKVDFTVGTDPRAVAIADMDGDGRLDIVVANSGSSTVSVLRNTATAGSIGAASFEAKVDFATGSHPFSVAIGDVDADGKPDLVTANLSAGTVSVLRNTGTTGSLSVSSFAPKIDFLTGGSPRFVTVNDLNADGRPEIALANAQTSKATVLFNTASPGNITPSSFTVAVSIDAGNSPNFIATGDIDGDGRPDLVTVNYGSNTVSVLRNNLPAGSFNSDAFLPKVDFATGPQPFFAAINDLDGDGKPDIAVVNTASTNISVLRNTAVSSAISSSSFAAKVDFAAGNYPTAIAAGDLDGDGIAELVAADAATNKVSALAFNSPQAISLYSFSPASGPVGSTVTITGDGYDFVPNLNQVFFGAVRAEITGGNSTTLQVKVPAGATYQPIRVSKNNNGLAATSPLPFVTTFANPFGTGIPANFYRPRVDVPLSGPFTYSVAFGDLNQDGKPDLMAVNEQANLLQLRRNVSATGSVTTTSFDSPVSFVTPAAPRSVAFADVDGYPFTDVLVLCPASYTLSVFQGDFNYGNIDATTFINQRKDFPTGGYASSFDVGDLDGDGRPEVVLTNPYMGTVSVLRNTSYFAGLAVVAFAPAVSYPVGNFPRSVAVIDVNGDGKRDLVVANEQGNTVAVLLNRAVQGSINAASFAPATTFPIGSNPSAVAAGDLDGDGKPEIVTSNYGSNSVSVLYNTAPFGTGSAAQFAPKVDFATGNTPYYVSIGDADGDGKPDIITANSNSNTLSVLRNTAGAGSITAASFAGKVDFATGGYPLGLAVGDLDGDGLAEIASANAGSGASAVSVFKIAGPVPVIATAVPGMGQTTAEQAGTAGLKLYPNPTRESFTLQLLNMQGQVANVEVLDESGKSVEKRTVNIGGSTARLHFSLHERAAGVYYVKVTGVEGVRVIQVMVQR